MLKARIIVAYAFLSVFVKYLHIYQPLHYTLDYIKKNFRPIIRHPLSELRIIREKHRCLTIQEQATRQQQKRTNTYISFKKAYDTLYRDFFREYSKHQKPSLADYAYVNIEAPALGSYFSRIVGVAWLCEKLGINIKFVFPDTYLAGSTNFFETSVLSYAKRCQHEKFTQLNKPLVDLDYKNRFLLPSIWEEFAKQKISGEYGYNIISKLSIKQDLQQQANQWYTENIKGACVGVHYRQTDVIEETRIISIESYIAYLKKVLDNRYDIFACSDNAQFIEEICKAFPDQVVARDIERSSDRRSLHRHKPYAGDQQRQDALIDILILAKTATIYTIGSYFVDITRFFNPSIKIISMSHKEWHADIANYLPIPHPDFVVEAQSQTDWKASHLEKEKPNNIEFERK